MEKSPLIQRVPWQTRHEHNFSFKPGNKPVVDGTQTGGKRDSRTASKHRLQ